MKKFEAPEVETIVFDVEDVITTSSGKDEGYEPGSGGVGGGMGM